MTTQPKNKQKILSAKEQFIKKISNLTGVQKSILYDFWNKGEDITIPAMTELNTKEYLGHRSMLMLEGIVHEYWKDKSNTEHTISLIKSPRMIAPAASNYFVGIPTNLCYKSLTELQGKWWPIKDLVNMANSNPKTYKIMMARIVQSLQEKQLREVRRKSHTAKERYLQFLEDHPGVINKVALKYVASYLFLTPETISRIRAELSKKN